jgi:hypothetical protein
MVLHVWHHVAVASRMRSLTEAFAEANASSYVWDVKTAGRDMVAKSVSAYFAKRFLHDGRARSIVGRRHAEVDGRGRRAREGSPDLHVVVDG